MTKQIIPIERIAQAIFVVRGEKVMLDYDLAALYWVETRVLNQAVKRNRDRFPADFIFRLTAAEAQRLRSQIVTVKRQRIEVEQVATTSSQIVMRSRGVRYRPYAFTEQGVAMLSSVLNSERAGERTGLACCRWRPRHRELRSCSITVASGGARFRGRFPARRRKEHARRVYSPIRCR
jgi:hypothetical protein